MIKSQRNEDIIAKYPIQPEIMLETFDNQYHNIEFIKITNKVTDQLSVFWINPMHISNNKQWDSQGGANKVADATFPMDTL